MQIKFLNFCKHNCMVYKITNQSKPSFLILSLIQKSEKQPLNRKKSRKRRKGKENADREEVQDEEEEDAEDEDMCVMKDPSIMMRKEDPEFIPVLPVEESCSNQPVQWPSRCSILLNILADPLEAIHVVGLKFFGAKRKYSTMYMNKLKSI